MSRDPRAFLSANRVPALFACLSYVFFLQIFPNFTNPNETSRFFLVSAIVEDHSMQIDKAMERYGDTKDKSTYNGHFYAAKPIGYSLLAVPFYWALHKASLAQNSAVSIWFLRFFVNLIPLLAFTIFFFRYLEKNFVGAGAYLLTAAFLFGTLFYPFAQVFISHVITGILWFMAFYYVVEKRDSWSAFAAGAILGFTFVIEVLSFIEIGACGLYLLYRRRAALPAFAAGVLVFSLPAFLYNYLVFGGLLQWPYLHTYNPGFKVQNTIGYVGVKLPSPVVLARLALGSYRGLFFYMPHLLFGLPAFFREKEKRAEALLAFGIVLGNFLFNSGMVAWDGGWCFGPRYLVPVIPFLIYGCALWLRQTRQNSASQTRITTVAFYGYLILLALTIPIMLFGTATFPYSPSATYNPVLWENFTLFWRGFFGLNFGTLAGWSAVTIGIVAIALVVVPTLLFVSKAGLARREFVVFALVLLLAFPASALLQRQIEARTPARDLFIIGICGYFQGDNARAMEYLRRAKERNKDPIVSQAIDAYTEQIRAGGNR